MSWAHCVTDCSKFLGKIGLELLQIVDLLAKFNTGNTLDIISEVIVFVKHANGRVKGKPLTDGGIDDVEKSR